MRPTTVASVVWFLLLSLSVVSDSLWPLGLYHTRSPCPPLPPGVYTDSCPSSWWCHPTISSSVAHFCSCPQSFAASGSFPMSWLFTSGGQSIGASASASVLPMKTQGWLRLGLSDVISWQSKGLSTVLSRTKVQKHQFFSFWLSSDDKGNLRTREGLARTVFILPIRLPKE